MPTSIHGTNGITFNDGSTQNTRPAVGFRNRIINGDMRIWQRGTTISNPNSTNFYTADRWGCNRASDVSGAVISRIPAALTGFQYALASQRVAGNTAAQSVSLWYSFESSDVYDLAGSSVTLSFWAKTGTTFSGGSGMFVAIYSGTGIDQRIYNMTGLTLVYSNAQALTSTWSRYTFTGTVPSNATQIGFQLTWDPAGTAGVDDSIKITGVQLEAGSTASDFERRPIGTELALCQRYYNLHGATTTAGNFVTICNGYMFASTQWEGVYSFPVEMRVSPTFTSSAASTFSLRNTNVVPTSILSYNATTKSVLLYTANTATASSGYSQSLMINASSTGFLAFSAEL